MTLTIYEFYSLRSLRDSFNDLKKEFKKDLFKTQRAMQMVIASYQLEDEIDPTSKDDLLVNPQFEALRAKDQFKKLVH